MDISCCIYDQQHHCERYQAIKKKQQTEFSVVFILMSSKLFISMEPHCNQAMNITKYTNILQA